MTADCTAVRCALILSHAAAPLLAAGRPDPGGPDPERPDPSPPGDGGEGLVGSNSKRGTQSGVGAEEGAGGAVVWTRA